MSGYENPKNFVLELNNDLSKILHDFPAINEFIFKLQEHITQQNKKIKKLHKKLIKQVI